MSPPRKPRDRTLILDRRRHGTSTREIAAEMRVSTETIRRDLGGALRAERFRYERLTIVRLAALLKTLPP